MNGDPNIDGFLNGKYDIGKIEPGQIIDRYSYKLPYDDTGKFLAPADSSWGSRALPPNAGNTYTQYEVIKEFEVKYGEIAPWFDQPRGGIQYYTDLLITDIDGNLVEASVKNLLENSYIRIVK